MQKIGLHLLKCLIYTVIDSMLHKRTSSGVSKIFLPLSSLLLTHNIKAFKVTTSS